MDETKYTKNAPNFAGVESSVGGWRWIIKGKQRGAFSLKDQAEIKIKHLKTKIYSDFTPCDNWMIRQFYFREEGTFGRKEFIDADYKPIKIGEHWGGEDVSAMWKQTITIGPEYKGKKVVLLLYMEGDSLVTINGRPYQGLDPFRNIVYLTDCAQGNEVYDIEVESYYMWHSNESIQKTLMSSHLAVVDDEMNDIYYDYYCAFNGLFMPDITPDLEAYLTKKVTEAVMCIDPYAKDMDEFREKARKGAQIIRDDIFNCKEFRVPGKLHLIGHSHLDLVFLWPYREFVRKSGRTHSAMLRLMDHYPEFKFSQSNAAMYAEMKEHYPEIYEEVKERIKEGRWEPVGVFWVEPECNMISGESFARQALQGARFYEKEFGKSTNVCWLPDVFGNSYGMPQILKKSGVDYFVTHKMSIWNDTNPWKENEFWWEGPDGSRVFACVPPTHFIGTMEADHLAQNWQKFSGKQGSCESIFCYGWGDGGGGCDTDMCEFVKRYKHFPGLPDAEPAFASEALESIASKAGNKAIVWKDELYLEAHRGVMTTKGELKNANRREEYLLRECEIYGVIARTMGYDYPQEELEKTWKTLLTTQFHDSLPGSHINEVYHTLMRQHKEITETASKIKADALAVIAKHIKADASKGEPIAVFNSLPYTTSSIAFVETDKDVTVADEAGNEAPVQKIVRVDGTTANAFYAKDVPAVGYKVFYIKPAAKKAESSMKVSATCMENDFFKVEFDGKGEITSIFDKKNNRETIAEGGKGNVFKLYEDMPGKYEAWDITKFYYDREIPLADGSIEVLENGPVAASVMLTKPCYNSEIKQRITIYKDIPRIDFETRVDWREYKKLLKVGFDVDIMAKKFTRDIAFGAIESPNYRYTPADRAKFEVSAHTWTDLSDPDYGVSLLNDCKYGHEVTRNQMRISLLKSSTYPDPEADRGINKFTYSYYPHTGTWATAETVQRALEFNVPFTVLPVEGKGECGDRSFASVSVNNVTLEAMKRAEDDGSVILHYCERCGKSADVTAVIPVDAKKVYTCNLLEKTEEELPITGNTISFSVNPYELKCFKVEY